MSGRLAQMPLFAILQAVICDRIPIEGSIYLIVYVNGDPLSCQYTT